MDISLSASASGSNQLTVQHFAGHVVVDAVADRIPGLRGQLALLR